MTDNYILKFTNPDAENTIEILPFSIDLSTSLTFYGKNSLNYWYDLNDNLLQLLTNFSNTKSPVRPIIGQIWFDKKEKKLKYFDKIWQGIEPQRPDLSMYVTIHDDTVNGNLVLTSIGTNSKSITCRSYVDAKLANCTYGDDKETGTCWVKHTDNNYVVISTSATKSGQTVTLPFEMSDTTYSIVVTSNDSTNDYTSYHWTIFNKTSTSFQIKFYGTLQKLAIVITGFAK